MKKQVKDNLLVFMRLTLYQLHPHFNDYPIEDMKNKEYSKGEEFEGTEYQDIEYLQQAYYMNQAIENIERI